MKQRKSFKPRTHSLTKNLSPKKHSLLTAIQPLIMKITELSVKDLPSRSYDDTSKEQICSFINKAPIATAFLDTNFHIQALSPSWHKWLIKNFLPPKSTITTLIGHPFLNTDYPHSQTLAHVLKLNMKGKSLHSERLEIDIPLHKKRWIRWESFPWFTQQGQIQGIIIFCEDVTQREEIYLDNQNLHHTNELLQNFSLIFSHDLIQPLRQISNYIYFMEDQLTQEFGNSGKIHDILNPVKKCIHQARDLCEGVAFYCKSGDLTINSESIYLGDVLNQITETGLKNTQIIFENHVTPQLKIIANKIALLQLFQNLFDNAIKHSAVQQPVIILSGKKLKGGMFQFCLRNNSYCPKSIKRKTIFNAFESSKINGAGLGLMICKKIVTAYGGKITLRSSPLKGTAITFTLPSSDSDALAIEQYQSNKKVFDESAHKSLEKEKTCEYNHSPEDDTILRYLPR